MGQAAVEGRLDVVKFFFFEKGVNNRSAIREVMHSAIYGGHLDVIEFLIEHYPHGRPDWNYLMITAIRVHQLDLVDFFIKKGARDKNRGLIAAIGIENFDLVKFFVGKRPTNMNEALELALKREYYKIAKFLVENGADPSKLTKEQRKKLGL